MMNVIRNARNSARIAKQTQTRIPSIENCYDLIDRSNKCKIAIENKELRSENDRLKNELRLLREEFEKISMRLNESEILLRQNETELKNIRDERDQFEAAYAKSVNEQKISPDILS